MSRTCVVSVLGPQCVIGLLAAVVYYGTVKQDGSPPKVITIFHNPGLSYEEMKESGEIIYQMIKPFGWAPPIVLSSGDVETITGHAFLKGPEYINARFRKVIGIDHADEVYFSHNLVGKVTDLCIQAYPNAERITSGEGTGQVYTDEYLTYLNRMNKKSLKYDVLVLINKIKKIVSYPPQTRLGSETQIVAFLPTDWNGKFSLNKKIIIVPRSIVKEIINTCSKDQTTLLSYCKNMIEQSRPPRFILLLSCWSEAGYMQPDTEIAMNIEIIHTNIPRGSTIFIKSHPSSRFPVAEGVTNQIINDYNVHIVPQEFKRYPLELMEILIEQCQVISFSTVILSIRYLFEKEVINPINEGLMKKFFPERTWYIIEDTRQWFSGAIHNLATWDGKSILWSGTHK